MQSCKTDRRRRINALDGEGYAIGCLLEWGLGYAVGLWCMVHDGVTQMGLHGQNADI